MSAHTSRLSPPQTAVSPTAVAGLPHRLQQDGYGKLNQEKMIQCKLSIGAVDDPLELEADTMADQVMRMPEQSFIQRKCDHCEQQEKENELQRKPLSSFIQKKESGNSIVASEVVENQIQSTRGSGSFIDAGARSFMENRFGVGFSDVKIHTNNEAVQMNRELNAKAFTVGNDIYFNEGQYQPGSTDGKQLLAHELTHTLQQGSGNDVNKQSIQRAFSAKCEKMALLPSLAQAVSGKLVHSEITAHFRSTVKGALGIGIPGAKADPFRTDELCGGSGDSIDPEIFDDDLTKQDFGIPDLARLNKGILEVAEIKPASLPCLVDGIPQLARYVAQGNMTDEAILKWKAKKKIVAVVPMKSSTYKPVTLNVMGYKVEAAWCAPGLMAYSVSADTSKRKKPKDPDESKKPKEPEDGKKPTEPEDGKKPAEKGKKPNASAGNFGFGLSILSSSVGGGNAGIGVSIMSNGASVCTASAGFIYDSNGAAIGTASAGISISSDSAAAASAGAGYSEDSSTAGAASASAGKSQGDTSAGAATASAGSSEGALTAGAATASAGSSTDATGASAAKAGSPTGAEGTGTGSDTKDAGTGDGKGTATDKGTGQSAKSLLGNSDFKAAVDAAVELDKLLQQASPAQQSLMIALSQRYPGHAFPISKAEWIGKIIFATTGLKDEDIKYLETFPWQEGHISKEELRDNLQKIVAQKDGGTLTFNYGDKIKIPISKDQLGETQDAFWGINSLSLPIASKIAVGSMHRGTVLFKFEKKDKTKVFVQLNNVELKCIKIDEADNPLYYFEFGNLLKAFDINDAFFAQATGLYASSDFIDWR